MTPHPFWLSALATALGCWLIWRAMQPIFRLVEIIVEDLLAWRHGRPPCGLFPRRKSIPFEPAKAGGIIAGPIDARGKAD